MKKLYTDIALLTATQVTNAMAITAPIPFMSAMVMQMGLVDSKNDTGMYTGIINCSQYLGRTICAPLWGKYADTRGRKPVILISLTALAILTLLFGFAVNLWWVLTLRFLIGVFTCLGPIVRT